MKNIFIILLFLISLKSKAQYPMVEEFNGFNGAGQWTTCCGAGLQNYGGAENYATTNIGSTPYPNNSNITLTSPVYDFTTTCSSNLTVSFPISGVIENGFDFLRFEYFNAGAWVIQSSFTGIQGSTPVYSIPNTATQFRFLLVTDCSVNGYKGAFNPCSLIGYPTTCAPPAGNCAGLISVYYYDITRFTIDCASPLPIELVSFTGEKLFCNENVLKWSTATETNNDHFEINRSSDAVNYIKIGEEAGAGNSTQTLSYYFLDLNPLPNINYYRLKQVDFNGVSNSSYVIFINNSCIVDLKVIKIVNLLGQEVNEYYDGPRFVYFNNGTVIKKLGNN